MMRQMIFVLAFSLAGVVPALGQAVAGLDQAPEAPHLLKDLPTDQYRLDLLGLAWEAATSYPLDPHIKNRGKAEEEVVVGALAIDQPHLAWGYAKQVVNWRRGACYAEIGHYLLERDEPEHVEYFLQQALLHGKDPKQGWRFARVKARVAAARVIMGDREAAEKLIETEDVTGQGERIGAQAAVAGEEEFEPLVATLDSFVARNGYDEILAAMTGYADLYERYYKDAGKRALLIAKTRAAWTQMPGLKRFEVMKRFIDTALAQGDSENAAALVAEADDIRKSFGWPLDYDLQFRSDIARYRVRLGQDDAARELLDASVALADEKLESIENFYRAGALRPVAEGYALLGDGERAHALYARVVELGAVNPNLRPRVSDITATCVSMALHGVEPDAKLLASIREIVRGLDNQ